MIHKFAIGSRTKRTYDERMANFLRGLWLKYKSHKKRFILLFTK